ncbi:zinc finger and SCAN domain-containing protein 21 [Pseudoliparis swirei]|uniref:zinc finger and SCAN domain-containing protein 21 n=1 Tax=Pseudoliparis swirei TaxID=2059687 RepID=UPI0024BEF554|nr:zinc finger and SCAN domain-containing protein 21 [Pseudoliparis swirei]
MSDLETLVVTFQTQLSDVMETVVKTAMYEVTRLVEEGFLEEMQRRSRELEALRRRLRRAESTLSGRGVERRRADGAKEESELASNTEEEEEDDDEEEERLEQDDLFGACGVKEEEEEKWSMSCTQEVMSESTRAEDPPTSRFSPALKSLTTDEDESSPAVDVKDEDAHKPSCFPLHWSGALDGEAALNSHGAAEKTEAQPDRSQENGENLSRDVMKREPPASPAYVFPEDHEDEHRTTEPSLEEEEEEEDSCWAAMTGLLQDHRLAPEQDRDPVPSEHALSDCVAAHADVLFPPNRDRVSAPTARLQSGAAALAASVKQEADIDSDGRADSEPDDGGKPTAKSRAAPFSCSANRHRASPEALKQNRTSHKAAVQEVMKRHARAGSSLRWHAALQHLHRPAKNSNGGNADSDPLTRTPSTSIAPPPPLSVHPGVKLAAAAAHDRAGDPWVSVKTHPSANPSPHPDAHAAGAAARHHLLRCGQCGKCFPHPSNLKAHLLTHTGERPFCCALCGRSFTKLSNLKAHRRVHTGERPYCCAACGKRFTQKCNLKRHQRIHLDV